MLTNHDTGGGCGGVSVIRDGEKKERWVSMLRKGQGRHGSTVAAPTPPILVSGGVHTRVDRRHAKDGYNLHSS